MKLFITLFCFYKWQSQFFFSYFKHFHKNEWTTKLKSIWHPSNIPQSLPHPSCHLQDVLPDKWQRKGQARERKEWNYDKEAGWHRETSLHGDKSGREQHRALCDISGPASDPKLRRAWQKRSETLARRLGTKESEAQTKSLYTQGQKARWESGKYKLKI